MNLVAKLTVGQEYKNATVVAVYNGIEKTYDAQGNSTYVDCIYYVLENMQGKERVRVQSANGKISNYCKKYNAMGSDRFFEFIDISDMVVLPETNEETEEEQTVATCVAAEPKQNEMEVKTVTEHDIKRAFEQIGKNFSGRQSNIHKLTPITIGGIEGTTLGTHLYFNHTGRDIDADFGHGRIKPDDMVIVNRYGNASRYTEYSTIPVEALLMRVGHSDIPVFRLRKDDCSAKHREEMRQIVYELNNFFVIKF